MYPTSDHNGRPVLESLEDRCVFAADTFSGAAAPVAEPPQPAQATVVTQEPSEAAPLAQQAQGGVPGDLQLADAAAARSTTIPIDTAFAQSGQAADPALIQPAALDRTLAVAAASATLAGDSDALATPASGLLAARPDLADPSRTPEALAFPGRLVLPGTGVQARAATGSGPLAQPPGLFLPGGTDEDALLGIRPRVNEQGRVALTDAEMEADETVEASGFMDGEEEAEQAAEWYGDPAQPWLAPEG